MDRNRDYSDLFKALNAHKVKYLVVGAHAYSFYAVPRYTKDIDIWIPTELNKPESAYKALIEFGAPLRGISPADFADKEFMLQIGVEPIRIDIMTCLSGINPQKAWTNRSRTTYDKVPVNIIGKQELLTAKRAAGRPQDRLDIAMLTKKTPSRKSRNKH